MKTLTILLAILLCFGCATAPVNPLWQMSRDSLEGRLTLTADQINQACADYDKARAEYEQTASYKAIPFIVAPLLLVGGALGDMPSCGYRGSGYGSGCLPSKAIVNTTPTAGGGTSSTIKWYR